MYHGSNTLDYNNYFFPYIIVYSNSYMSIFRAINSLEWVPISHSVFYTSPRIYHLYTLKKKKGHRLNQQRTQRAPSPLKSNTFWVTTSSCWHYLKWPMIANGESVVLPVTSSLLGFCFWLVHYSASRVSNSWVFGVLWLSVSQMSDCSELA